MKRYIIYKELPAPDGNTVPVYLKANGDFTYDEFQAKEYRVKWWVEMLKIILELILKFGFKNNLKIKKL